jgi:hypothetical protein
MKKEVDIFKVKDKKLPKHDQRVLVKKKVAFHSSPFSNVGWAICFGMSR